MTMRHINIILSGLIVCLALVLAVVAPGAGAADLEAVVSAGLDSPELPQSAAKKVQDRMKINLLFIIVVFDFI